MKIGEVVYRHVRGGSIPYYYLGEGMMYGNEVSQFVEAPSHVVDTAEIKILGIKDAGEPITGQLPRGSASFLERFAEGGSRHAELIQQIKDSGIPLEN